MFRCVERWEKYHSLKDFLVWYDKGQIGLPTDLLWLIIWLIIFAVHWVSGNFIVNWTGIKIADAPSTEEEVAWKMWVHENLNEGKIDPKETQFSLLCVIGWSKYEIMIFVVLPFGVIAFGSVLFGILWSVNIRGHQGTSLVPGL